MRRIRSTPRACRSALPALNTLVVLCLGLIWGGSDISRAYASVHGRGALAVPHLISLTYGRYRPGGAPHAYLALRLTALEPHGQVVGAQFVTSAGHVAIGDGGCGLGGRRNGQIETFYMPLKLSSGVHKVAVTVVGAACTASTETRTATRTFRITAR